MVEGKRLTAKSLQLTILVRPAMDRHVDLAHIIKQNVATPGKVTKKRKIISHQLPFSSFFSTWLSWGVHTTQEATFHVTSINYENKWQIINHSVWTNPVGPGELRFHFHVQTKLLLGRSCHVAAMLVMQLYDNTDIIQISVSCSTVFVALGSYLCVVIKQELVYRLLIPREIQNWHIDIYSSFDMNMFALKGKSANHLL